MLRHMSDTAFHFLLLLYNNVYEGVFPDAWGEALLLSFLKKDKPPIDPGSYRPIVLTSCTGKLLERILNKRLQHFLEMNNILTERQLGFRRMRSTEDAHVLLQTAIANAFALRQQLVAVFFDLRKAYGMTWRYDIVRAVHQSGIRSKLAMFIKNFLANRIFKVKYGSCLFKYYEQEQEAFLAVTCLLLL